MRERLARWWFAPAPPERLAVLRVAIYGFGLVWMVTRYRELLAVARLPVAQFAHVGVTRALDAPLPQTAVAAIAVATIACLTAAGLGLAYRYVAPLAAAGLWWTLTYRNSWGMVFHTENLLVLHCAALAVMPAADAWSIDAWRHRKPRERDAGYGWACKLLAALTAATYLLAGIAKLRIAGTAWLDGELLRNQIAIDNVRKAVYGSAIAPLATLFLEHPQALTIFSVGTLGLELGAPLALAHRRVAWLWALGAWSFHVGVVALMNIWFPYPLSGIPMLPLFEAERPVRWIMRGIAEWRAR